MSDSRYDNDTRQEQDARKNDARNDDARYEELKMLEIKDAELVRVEKGVSSIMGQFDRSLRELGY